MAAEESKDDTTRAKFKSPPVSPFASLIEALTPQQEEMLGVLVNKHAEQLKKWWPQLRPGKEGKKHQRAFHKDYIRRFFVARNWDPVKTEEMVDAMWKWRDDNLPVKLEEVMPELKKGKWYESGVDRDGRPCFTCHSGRFDPEERDLQTAYRSIIYIVENMLQKVYEGKYAKSDGYVTVVYDRSTFTMKNFDKGLYPLLGKGLQDNYPERLVRALVYPAGLVFRTLWGIVQWFFDEKTRTKVQPLKSKEQFLEYVAPVDGVNPWEYRSPYDPDSKATRAQLEAAAGDNDDSKEEVEAAAAAVAGVEVPKGQ